MEVILFIVVFIIYSVVAAISLQSSVEELFNLLFKWQPLGGAFIGAATPIGFWFFIRWRERKQKIKESRYYLEKVLVSSINGVIDAKTTIKRFIDDRLSQLIKRTDEYTKKGMYSVETAYFPMFYLQTIDESIFALETGSGYLDNQVAQVVKVSKDFALGIDDLRNQFRHTIESNYDIALRGVNSQAAQNSMFKDNLEEFQRVVERDIFDTNINIYLRLLVATRVTNSKIQKIGLSRWKLKFSPSFRYFKNQAALKEYEKRNFDRIDEFLKEEVETEVQNLSQHLK